MDYDEIDAIDKARSRCEEPLPHEQVPEFYYWVIRPDQEEPEYEEPRSPDGFTDEQRWDIMMYEVDADLLERLPIPPFLFNGDMCEVWVDEEGLLKERKPNHELMELVNWPGLMPLVGNAVVIPTHMIQ